MDWKDCWEKGNMPWHIEDVHPKFLLHVDKITEKKNNAKIFFPLCGKAVEMFYLAKKGHTIVGVEYMEIAVKQFFDENKLSYETKPVPEIDGDVYENEANNIKIYCGDYFKFSQTLETNFDGVWDRGALEAVLIDQRGKYTDVMKAVMKRGAPCVTEVPDRPEGEGPPFNLNPDEITHLYDLKTPPEKVDYDPASESLKSMNVDGMFYYYYKINS
ncbi:thiopurine S-methyltransferase-like [Mytilus trossulus]|uniref:thiopurine S-methyltransferase-like n=1 Tax=Mytilus trossulus TaxID=6551 RepID=UPI003006B036